MTAPVAVPTPPNRLVPPITAEAMTVSSSPVPAVGTATPIRETNSIPASP